MIEHLITPDRFFNFQLRKFLGTPNNYREPIESLISKIINIFQNDPAEEERFLETFEYELAVDPEELDELLGCNPTERIRWINEGKIPILRHNFFVEDGIIWKYPLHERRFVISLSQDKAKIQKWRDDYEALIKRKRQIASQAATETRKRNKKARQDFISSWDGIKSEWRQKGSPEISAVLQLAYWTVWAERWAQENALKTYKARTNYFIYSQRRKEWQDRRNQAVEFLWKTPWSKLFFYRPKKADKISIDLCHKHLLMRYRSDFYNKWEYFYYNRETVLKCPHCDYSEEKDYYSLYYLEIKTEQFPEFSFSFQTPHPTGQTFLPNPETLPKLYHIHRDDIFRDGRALLEQEKIVLRENDVLANFEKALADAKGYLPVWGL
jgi:hypothetical protein